VSGRSDCVIFMASELSGNGDVALDIDKWQGAAELRRRRLALMRFLQSSLDDSRRALVALDLAAIERGTLEQRELILRLAEEIGWQGELMTRAVASPPERDSGRADRRPRLDLDDELCRSQLGVLQAVKVQSALLDRMRKKSRVLANLLAGLSMSYGPSPRENMQASMFAFRSRFKADSTA